MTPDKIVEMNGVKVYQKIIPDGTRWKDTNKAAKAGFKANALYKAQVKMPKVNTITVHNTNDLDNIEDDAERYVLATYNENMGSTRPHLYTDDKSTWQLLSFDEVAWCNGRGSSTVTGAIDDIAIECVMGEDSSSDSKAEDNAARLAAYLLHKHNLGIDALRTHTYWINLGLGVKGSVDYMNTYRHPNAPKYCPYYILPHWAKFKALVKKYLDALNKPATEMYRIRKTWADVKTQIGAFTNLESAKDMANYNEGYKVFNSKGQVVYTPAQYYTKYSLSKTDKAYKDEIFGAITKGTQVDVLVGTERKENDGAIWIKALYNSKTVWLPLDSLQEK